MYLRVIINDLIIFKQISHLSRHLSIYRFTTTKIGNKFELNPDIPEYLKQNDFIEPRFIGSNQEQIQEMLKLCNSKSLDRLADQIIPASVKNEHIMEDVDKFPDAVTESTMLQHLNELAKENKLNKNYIGQGFYGTHTPNVILRNVFEDPGWYTSYTPYQAEVSQGRLEALLNYQTVVSELTGMDVANASLLDEASAAGEAMFMAYSWYDQDKKTFFIDQNVFPQCIEYCQTKAKYLGINIIIGDAKTFDFNPIKKELCGVYVQSPDNNGLIYDWTNVFKEFKTTKSLKIVGCDLLSLCINKTPGEMGANVALGNSQRFGVPMGFGGPHAAFFAVKDKFKRKMPGRIIGISKDSNGKDAFRMSLQTREQHIRREKATSNICTAQALLANMAGLYATYHGPSGLVKIANRVNSLARLFDECAQKLGFVTSTNYFDTVQLQDSEKLVEFLHKKSINIRQVKNAAQLSFDETHTIQDIVDLVNALKEYKKSDLELDIVSIAQGISPQNSQRDYFMKQEIFNSLHSETEMLRYINYLRGKDFSLTKSMISLGSCTMKCNPVSFMMPVSYPGFSQLHPYSPSDCTKGYQKLINNISTWLCELTQMAAISLQPNSGAQGEYTGLLCIRKYHSVNKDDKRTICLIPISAHGTNPASAILAGFSVVPVNVSGGFIDIDDLQKKIIQHKDTLACMMLTYPSTYGVYEDKVKDIIDLVHSYGGLVYMDGANMNAQVGYTSPGFLGADVCHLNLHKTFSIPHGGGGPGLGPICVNDKLAPFIPGGKQSLGIVAASAYSSASILPISYSYLGQLGRVGVKKCTIMAMLNANYLKKSLNQDYQILYKGQNDMCAHEFIIDIRPIKQQTGITEEDIAKRLIDYGFHAPTMSFPVPGTLMIEPTESESKYELDRFILAMKNIRKEIYKIQYGEYDKVDNPLKNAPHTQERICGTEWKHKYTREEAAFPLEFIRQRGKIWPSVGRINNAQGDRNLICQCGDMSDYK